MTRHGNQPDLRSRPSPRPARPAATLRAAVCACWFAVTLLTGEWTCVQAVEDSAHPRLVQPVGSIAPSTPERYVKGELLVRFKDGPFGPAAAEIHRQIGSAVIRSFPNVGWQLVRLPTGMTVSEALLAYRDSSGVRAAEPNGYLIPAERRHLVPDDPRLVEQWGLTRICPGVAWGLSTGSPDIVVATIDSGVKYDHEDLVVNMWRNLGEIGTDAGGMDKESNGIDDDANGYVDDVYGIDCCDNDSDPWDDWGHGTCTAGIIGAVGCNGIGICGVNWQTRIMALKIFGPDSSGYAVSSVLECYEYVIATKERGINIRLINNSYGSAYQQSLRDAIDTAGALGILSICAAGNSGQDIEVEPTYPASYDSPFVVSVTSTMLDEPSAEEVHDPSTNWGKISVDLAAPGTDILSTTARGLPYVEVSGTSFATPHVTGAAALLWSIEPAASPSTIKSLLLNSVDLLPSLEGRVVSGGRLNLGRAALDLIAPEAPSAVLAFLPSGSGTAVDSVATLVFSKPMDLASVESGLSVSQISPGSFSWSNLDRTVTFRPGAAWHDSGVLTFRLPGNVRDIMGRQLDGNFNQVSEGSPTDDFVWTFTFLPPTIHSLEPSYGEVGDTVKILGTNLTQVTNVRFAGVEAGFQHARILGSLTIILAKVPVGAASGPVEVESPAGTCASAEHFRVGTAALPALVFRRRSESAIILAWSASSQAVLVSSTNLNALIWGPEARPPLVVGDENQLSVEPEDGQRFYRLRSP